jgi:hypothetical protein
MVDDYLVQFCAKAASETQVIDFPWPGSADVAFARDDAQTPRGNCGEPRRALLGSFSQLSSEANSKTQFIFVNPVIISFRPEGQSLRLWVSSPQPGMDGNTEAD